MRFIAIIISLIYLTLQNGVGEEDWARVVIPTQDKYSDAEEFQNEIKEMSIGSYWLYLGSDDEGLSQKVGLRFDDIPISPEATIHKAYIQFSAALKSPDEPSSVKIKMESSVSPSKFDYSAGNISNRALGESSVTWDIKPWLMPGRRGKL